MKQTTRAVPDGIVFVLDPGNAGALVPAYVPDRVAAATPTCVSVATIPEVDGSVRVILRQANGETHLLRVFDGSIETPGRKLAIVTSQFETVLETDVTSTLTRVTVDVDEPKCPRIVSVGALGLG